jgi:cell division protein FtsA
MARAERERSELIVGLDIGTTKIAAVVGNVHPGGEVEIIGIGTHPSKGLKRGVVSNIEATTNSIRHAIEEAELMADCEIRSVFAGIAGKHIEGRESKGIQAIRPHNEVTRYDIERVLDAARAIAIPTDKKILHVLPKQYMIDDQSGILEPLGMAGVRLEADVHIVIGSVSAAQNIIKCVRMCGLEAEDVVLEQLASSYSVLSEDEKEIGVCLVDIGGGTTDIAVFTRGSIRYTSNIPIAGDQVTNDIAVFLRTPIHQAEDIKSHHACALSEMVDSHEEIEVPSIGDRPPRRMSRQSLAEVVGPRYAEMFALIQAELRRSGYEGQIAAGIVLTGGSSRIEGAVELAEEIFNMPVRIGVPTNVTGLIDVVRSPIYATGVGLLLYGVKHRQHELVASQAESFNVWETMKNWFKRNF